MLEQGLQYNAVQGMNIRILDEEIAGRLAANMRYGETMADAIHALIEQARDESDSSDAPPCK